MGLGVHRSPEICTLQLGPPPGNILDREICLELAETIRLHGNDPDLKAFLITAGGKNFSYGASIQEHLRSEVKGFLSAFHDVFEALMTCDVPAIAAVQGRCLGGAFELAAFCHFRIAEATAIFALPEIQLGVFPPFACAAFPELIGRTMTERLVLSGREITADEALRCGAVTTVCGEGELDQAVATFLKDSILPRSAAALRLATSALRAPLNARIRRRLPDLEHRYLEDLMSTHDAEEGLQAFLEKREPVWVNA